MLPPGAGEANCSLLPAQGATPGGESSFQPFPPQSEGSREVTQSPHKSRKGLPVLHQRDFPYGQLEPMATLQVHGGQSPGALPASDKGAESHIPDGPRLSGP